MPHPTEPRGSERLPARPGQIAGRQPDQASPRYDLCLKARSPGGLCPAPLVCLRPGFEHHVEGTFGGAAHAAKARALQHLGQLGFAGLRPKASPTSCDSEVGTQIMVDAL